MKIVIYGAGMTGKSILKELRTQLESNEIVFVDSDHEKWGTYVGGAPVVSPDELLNINFDKIIIGAAMGRETIWKYLTDSLGIDESKIEYNNPLVESYFNCYETRAKFIENFAEVIYEKGIRGNIGEGGVFEGRFSRVLSENFPDRKLYMFDTFEGFDSRDVEYDINNNLSIEIKSGLYSSSKSVNEVVQSLSHPENAIVKKGYFPESAKDVSDTFVFVNLDFDLYKPTIEGLKFFYPQMVNGGVILVHDYFNAPGIIEDNRYFGIRKACDEFCEMTGVTYIPIGDEMSVAFVKGQ